MKTVNIDSLKGVTINSVNFGHPSRQETNYDGQVIRSSYGVLHLKTDKGEFVLSCSMLASQLTLRKVN